MKTLTYTLLLMLMLTTCCTRTGQHEHILSLIDSLIETDADSALALIQQNREEMKDANEDNKAYFSLLSIKAEDKAKHIPTSDSLICLVAEQFEKSDPNGHLFETYYYMGRINLQLSNGEKAFVCFQRALLEDSTHLSPQLRSLIYTQVGDIYLRNDLLEEAIGQKQLAYFYSKKAHDAEGMRQAIKQMQTIRELMKDSTHQDISKIGIRERLQKINTQIKSQVLKNLNDKLEEENAREKRNMWTAIFLAILSAAIPSISFYRIRKQRALLKKKIEKVQASLSMPSQAMPERKPFYDKDINEMLDMRIRQQKVLKEADWQLIETRLKDYFPSFKDRLYSIYSPSDIEYQICMLIKMGISPSNIAKLLALGNSAVSQSRLRMQQKVFDGQGGAKDWDKFILSI